LPPFLSPLGSFALSGRAAVFAFRFAGRAKSNNAQNRRRFFYSPAVDKPMPHDVKKLYMANTIIKERTP
jgi:hypothetical protein